MGRTADAARSLLRACAEARRLDGTCLVVKLGGSAMEEPAATAGMLDAVAALHRLRVRLVLVHGGGKPIDRAMAAAGLTPRKVMGRRYTDAATLDVVVRTLCDINKGLEKELAARGVDAIGFHDPRDIRGFPLIGSPLTLADDSGKLVDLGRVGEVSEVDPIQLILHERNRVPVLPSLAHDGNGGWLNINADTAAGAVAGALAAEACLFLTDTPGVLRDVRDPASLLPRLTKAECDALIRDGVIAGGMVPKVEACLDALAAGARKAVILDGRDPHSLLARFVSDEPAGTEIVP